jgi:dipeptidase E
VRLFLTSNALPSSSPSLREEFLNLVGKTPRQIRVVFIPTASAAERDGPSTPAAHSELMDIGIPAENIVDLELDHPISVDELMRFDVIFVDGGNTFYLLQKVRESGFEAAIREYLRQDRGVYVGVSAGTILAGPDIEIAAPWDNKNAAVLSDTKGLGMIATAYSPHYKPEDDPILNDYRSKVTYPIQELRDGEAVLSDGAVDRLVTG